MDTWIGIDSTAMDRVGLSVRVAESLVEAAADLMVKD